ncbi:hypothetical protein HRbin23_00332 [bacterium HR23]|nr:hypothetical protein HRbin23_00332 [bacterium HR23]
MPSVPCGQSSVKCRGAPATYTLLPALFAQKPGATALGTGALMADGRCVVLGIAEAQVRIEGRARTTIVVFGPEGPDALLGAHTPGGLLPHR